MTTVANSLARPGGSHTICPPSFYRNCFTFTSPRSNFCPAFNDRLSQTSEITGTWKNVSPCLKSSENVPQFVIDFTHEVLATFQLRADEFHNDSTTVSFYGACKGAAEEDEREGRPTPAITFGHSKARRPDLKQLLPKYNIVVDLLLKKGLRTSLRDLRTTLFEPKTLTSIPTIARMGRQMPTLAPCKRWFVGADRLLRSRSCPAAGGGTDV